MKRYGGHYKVKGPCVSVPTQLDQVLEILPWMPNQLQLHPLKLKCKLEYKSHYMYNMIWKDTVIEAITWLKQHNPHYADIIPNDDWYSSITNSGLTTLVHKHAVHQETSQSTVVNINTHTHNPHLDDTEQTTCTTKYRWYFTSWGKQSCCNEKITPMMMKKLTVICRKNKQPLIASKRLTGDCTAPKCGTYWEFGKFTYTSVYLVKITYQNISYLMKTLKSWHFLISFHMVKEGIIQNEVQNYLYKSTSNSIY